MIKKILLSGKACQSFMKNILYCENNERKEYLNFSKTASSSYAIVILVVLTREHIYNLTAVICQIG